MANAHRDLRISRDHGIAPIEFGHYNALYPCEHGIVDDLKDFEQAERELSDLIYRSILLSRFHAQHNPLPLGIGHGCVRRNSVSAMMTFAGGRLG